MTHQAFDHWLTTYGAAWEARDAGAFAGLFTEAVRYYWTPFEEPKKGRQGVAEAFSNALANQRDIHFSYEILAVDAERCVARWWCALVRPATGHPVRLDGILLVEPTADGTCEVVRGWWHSDEKVI